MLGIWYCTQFECGMNEANHEAVADGQPIWFCPEDEMKIWWACRVDPADRYRRLAEFAEKYRVEREAEFWRTSERRVTENGPA